MLRSLVVIGFLAAACTSAHRAQKAPARQGTDVRVASATPAAAPDAKPEKDPLICRVERPTGSNYAKRICFRQSELEEKRRQAQDLLLRANQNTPAGPPVRPPPRG
jgi:hypothetical protein